MTQSRPQYTPEIEPAQYFGDPETFVIPRNGDRDLVFKGWILSSVTECSKPESGYVTKNSRLEPSDYHTDAIRRCLAVTIYLTNSDRVVGHLRRWREELGEEVADSVQHEVEFTYTDRPGHILEWLKADNKGRLGATSKQAWVEACQAWPRFEDEAVERI